MSESSKLQKCVVKLLDGEEFVEKLNVSTTYAVTLFDKVCSFLKITEKDYFSLRFIHPKDKLFSWLNLRKTLKQQLKEGPYTFFFFVKFFPPDPCTLQEDLTRYLFVLAIRDLIFMGMLVCSTHTQLMLSSFIVQAEFGDWTPELRKSKYLNGLRFIPNQPDDFEERLVEYHKQHQGLTSEEVELQYLKMAKDLDFYGVEMYDVKDEFGVNYIFGVSFRGLVLLEDSRELYKIFWPELVSVSFFKKTISLKILLSNGTNKNLSYKCATRASTKRLYRSIVEYHTFFRRPLPLPPVSGMSLSSRFRYNGRKTYLQLRKSLPSSANLGGDSENFYTPRQNIDIQTERQKTTSIINRKEQGTFDDEYSDLKNRKVRIEYSDEEKDDKVRFIEYETKVFEARFDSMGRIVDGSKVFYTEKCNLGVFEDPSSLNISNHSTSTYLI